MGLKVAQAPQAARHAQRCSSSLMASTGTIKKFFEEKGFGFITPDDGSEDIFCHVKECPDLDGCGPGDAVAYDTKWDDRKNKSSATNLTATGAKSGGGGGGNGGYGGGKGGGKGKKGGDRYEAYGGGRGW